MTFLSSLSRPSSKTPHPDLQYTIGFSTICHDYLGRPKTKVMEHRKFTFLGLSQFVHHHLLWFLISAYAIAAVFPTAAGFPVGGPC
jgi:hypothetical protein